MIVKAFLAAMGLRAMPGLHNHAVHEALNAKAAAMAGHARIMRLSAAAGVAAAAGETGLVKSVHDQQCEVRDALDELARRLD